MNFGNKRIRYKKNKLIQVPWHNENLRKWYLNSTLSEEYDTLDLTGSSIIIKIKNEIKTINFLDKLNSKCVDTPCNTKTPVRGFRNSRKGSVIDTHDPSTASSSKKCEEPKGIVQEDLQTLLERLKEKISKLLVSDEEDSWRRIETQSKIEDIQLPFKIEEEDQTDEIISRCEKISKLLNYDDLFLPNGQENDSNDDSPTISSLVPDSKFKCELFPRNNKI